MVKEAISGVAVLAAGFSEVDKSWLSQAAIFIAAMSATAFYIRGVFRKHPPDEQRYAPAAGFARIEKRFDKFEDEVSEQLASLNKDNESRAVALHGRVNHLAADVSGIKTATELQNQRISQIDSRLSAHIEKGIRK